MRRSHGYRRASAVMGINLTPLVDVIFILTIFFMLVSRFSSAEQVTMELPKPEGSQAQVMRMPQRVVVNCRLATPGDPETSPVVYSIGPNRPEPLSVVADRIAGMKAESPEMKVVIRADRRIRYGHVRAAMRMIAASDVEMLNVAAHVGEGD